VAAGNLVNTETTVASLMEEMVSRGRVSIAIYLDVDESNSFTDGDFGLKNDGTTYVFGTARLQTD
jgi:hypothetical protein